MEIEGSASSGSCALHPEEAATGHCSHCGTFGCESCLGWLGTRLVCRTCVEEGRVKAHAGVPWERRSEIGWLRAIGASARELALRPTAFFANMNPDGDLGEALLFAVLAPAVPILGWCSVIGIGAAGALAVFTGATTVGSSVVSEKNGISAKGLQRQLGFSNTRV